MNRACAIERIADRRRLTLIEELREWDERQVRQYTAHFLDAMRVKLAARGPERGPWDGTIRVPPGLVPRDAGLRDLRLRCYARLMARRHVASMRRWERQ